MRRRVRHDVCVDMVAKVEADADAPGVGIGVCVGDVGEAGGVGEADR